MLNWVWLGLIALSVVIGGLGGRIGEVGTAAIGGARDGVSLAASLVAIMTLWLGLMHLASRAGLVRRLGMALKPLMRRLFPEVPPDHPALGSITMNFAANLLGLSNAATPLGLKAMAELESLNPRPGVATNAMCMLLAINSSNLTLIPATAIAVLASVHAKNPTAIVATSLLATALAQTAAIVTAKLLEHSPMYRLPPAPAPIERLPVEAAEAAGDERRPWVPGGRILLALLVLLLPVLAAVTAFPELIGRTASAEQASRAAPWRIMDAVSAMAIPWLILAFPAYAALRRLAVFEEFVEGAKEGFGVALRILPYVVGMMVAVGMFRASGGMDLLAAALRPLTDLAHIPPELVPMALIRPFSSAAALGILGDLAHHYPPDSLAVMAAATLYGCSETTFYVIAVYFGSVGVKKTRHAIPAGIAADLVGPIASVIVCNAMFG
jgi:spore maturation protein SpmA